MCLAGAASGLCYHIIKTLFEPIKSPELKGVLVGVLVSLCYGFILTFTAYYYNHAHLRYFMPIAFLLGSVIYFLTVGKLVILIFEKIWSVFFKICSLIFKILLTPVRFLLKIIMMPIGMAGRMLSKLKARLSVLIGRFINEQRKKAKFTKKHPRNRGFVRSRSGNNDNSRYKHSAGHKPEQAGNS
ncbi:MAG: hypothetical protein IJ423_00710 [Clostridia bacterium]|nr:hypothetical protein [Clostridia bacterium]